MGAQSNCFLLLNENVVSWNQSYMLWYQGGPPGSPRSANTNSVRPLSMRSRSVGSGSPGCNVATFPVRPASSKAANAQRGIYMCHSNCETGAIKFGDGLEEIKTFLDGHPDDVLMLTLHDFTSPADTAAAIEAAGLADRAFTLQQIGRAHV